MRKQKIYLDYAATTPLDKEVQRAMLVYWRNKFGNPMSVHGFGREAQVAIDDTRQNIAKFFNADSEEIIFTSGATESNNLAIKGVIEAFLAKNPKKIPHIITTKFEHSCVIQVCEKLEKQGKAEVTYLPVYKEGIVKAEDVKKAIRKNTLLISVMYVNNEIGTVQPIAEIGKLIKKENPQIVFHTDAVQAINYFDCDVNKLKVDLLSFSGHKIYGPKGIGGLYIKKGTSIFRIQDGGTHEYQMRAGTHNVPAIVGLGKALSMINEQRTKNNKVILNLRNHLIKRVLKEIPGSYLNGSKDKRSPNNANFSFDNVEGEGLILALDMEGIAASTGSACSSGALEPSHVLLALGLKHEQAHGSLRLTLGKYTTKKEIDITVNKLKKIITRLRKISGGVMKEFE